jgi:hypothetical protein
MLHFVWELNGQGFATGHSQMHCLNNGQRGAILLAGLWRYGGLVHSGVGMEAQLFLDESDA